MRNGDYDAIFFQKEMSSIPPGNSGAIVTILISPSASLKISFISVRFGCRKTVHFAYLYVSDSGKDPLDEARQFWPRLHAPLRFTLRIMASNSLIVELTEVTRNEVQPVSAQARETS